MRRAAAFSGQWSFLRPPGAGHTLRGGGRLAQHEILHATGIVKNKPVVVIAMVCASAVPFWVLWGLKPLPALIALFVLVVVLFLIRMVDGTYTFAQIGATLFSIVIPPLFLSLALLIRIREGWRYMILLPFLAAWMSDTGAFLQEHTLENTSCA